MNQELKEQKSVCVYDLNILEFLYAVCVYTRV